MEDYSMKKFLLFAGVVLFCSIPAHAQSADVSVGYSYFRLGGSGGVNQNGVSGSLAYNANNWLGLVGDFGGYHASPGGGSLNTYTFLLGPRFTLRNPTKINPFVQGLVGGAHLTASAGGISTSTNAFAYSFGGGVDLGVLPHLAFRPQVDYVGLRNSGVTTNCTRISISAVIHF
jgi:hypothetical protein